MSHADAKILLFPCNRNTALHKCGSATDNIREGLCQGLRIINTTAASVIQQMPKLQTQIYGIID